MPVSPRRALAALAIATGSMLLAAPITVGSAGAALAHDILIRTVPADGATVGAAPGAVVLTFEEPVSSVGALVRVTGPRGEEAAGTPVLAGTTVRQPLRPGAPAGRYAVGWRVTSVDGHPVSGSFGFTVRSPTGRSTAGTPPVTPTTTGGATALPSAPVSAAPGSNRGLLFGLGVAVLALVVSIAAVIAVQARHRPS